MEREPKSRSYYRKAHAHKTAYLVRCCEQRRIWIDERAISSSVRWFTHWRMKSFRAFLSEQQQDNTWHQWERFCRTYPGMSSIDGPDTWKDGRLPDPIICHWMAV